MKCHRHALLLVILSLWLLAPTPAVSGDEEWVFVWAEPARGGYEVWQGRGVVTLRDGVLSAKTRAKDGVEFVTLTGRVSNGKVTASVTVFGSEFGDVPFSGTYVDRSFEVRGLAGAPSRTQSIVLTNGLIVVALRRDVFGPPAEIPPTSDR